MDENASGPAHGQVPTAPTLDLQEHQIPGALAVIDYLTATYNYTSTAGMKVSQFEETILAIAGDVMASVERARA